MPFGIVQLMFVFCKFHNIKHVDRTQIRAVHFNRQFGPNPCLRQIGFDHGTFKTHQPTFRVTYKTAFGT